MHYVVTMSRPPSGNFPLEEPTTGPVQALDIDTGRIRISWGTAAVVLVFAVGAAAGVGTFVANSARRSEVAPVTIVAEVKANTDAVAGLKRDVEQLQEGTSEVRARLDMLIRQEWRRADTFERHRMRREARQIQQEAGADPLSGIEEQ